MVFRLSAFITFGRFMVMRAVDPLTSYVMFSKLVDASVALMELLLSLLNGFPWSMGWYCSMRRLWCCSTNAQGLYLLSRKAEFEQYFCGVLPNFRGAARRYLLCANHLHRAVDGTNFWFRSLDGHQDVVG